ncbi:MAG TPA: type II toxin-antitoxin system HipA family toxin [Acetobacteraceae bacterium]|nr:type II toxin-antitoxin system HipA family toxin [Acetobacteraceae bacterium]
MTELVALLDGRQVGVVRHARGRLSFEYADDWRDARGAYPLSLSMPLAARTHGHPAIEPFLWGLLPDNEVVLARWGQRFQVSPRSAFALLGAVGEDCAGAVQFVQPERLADLSDPAADTVTWLTDDAVAARLRALQADASAGRAPQDTGQFSLAGAQPKTALVFDGQRWGVPAGRIPTTHILKPPSGVLDGHVENEHLCLALARALGLPTARSELRRFGNVTAIVIERYDRVRVQELAAARAAETAMHAASDAPDSAAKAAAAAVDAANLAAFARTTPIFRVHQEDFCQALRHHPARKYQNDGGPGPRDIVALLRAAVGDAAGKRGHATQGAADEDVATFLDGLLFNWLIGGTDAHAKNYALLIGGGGLVRLAPFYDLASILGHPGIDSAKARLAMKIGRSYRLHAIGLDDWRQLARDLRWNEDRLIARLRGMARALPDALADEATRLQATELAHPVVPRLQAVLTRRARAVVP